MSETVAQAHGQNKIYLQRPVTAEEHAVYFQRKQWRMERRTFLRASGVAVALPWLEAMGLRSASVTNAGEISPAETPRRAYFSNWGFFEAGAATPKDTGRDYTLTPTLSPLAPYRDDCTVFTGMKAFSGGHYQQTCMLTGMNTPTNGVKLVSVDQQIADYYQGQTRIPSLVLANNRTPVLSWSRNKTPINPENSPQAVFDRLFGAEDDATRKRHRVEMAHTGSILDRVRDQARSLEKRLGKNDRATVDQYFTSIRDFEERIKIDLAWMDKPKPQVAPMDFGKSPAEKLATTNDDGTCMRNYLQLMFDVIVLAFQTDSTRVVSHFPKGEDGPVFKERTKVPHDYHALTHHGQLPEKFQMWATVDQVYMEFWAYFIGKLKSVPEGNGTLLDHTMAAWATTNGEGGHGREKLPLILCGGAGLGVKHQGHLIKKDVMIGNVWQTMVDRLNMPVPRDFQGGQANGLISEIL